MTDPITDIRDAFFDEVYAIAREHPEVIFLAADLGAFSLNRFKADLPKQYINVGVAEQNMISVSAGLALGGKRPFAYSLAAFATLRCYEQIKVDLAGMDLPVTVVSSGPGISYSSDGPTHHAVQDVAVMRALPNVTIFSPADAASAASAARLAYAGTGPAYVRVDKGQLPPLYEEGHDFSDGIALIRDGRDVTIAATGIMTHRAIEVANALKTQGVDAAVVDVYRLKPVNEELLLNVAKRTGRIVSIEEHSLVGGLGSIVSEIFTQSGTTIPLKSFGLSEVDCPGYGDRDWMHRFYGLDTESLTNGITSWLAGEGSQSPSAYRALGSEDFTHLLGAEPSAVPPECRKLIAETDFRYHVLQGSERDRLYLRVVKTLESNLTIAGPERQDVWEKGWSENYRNFIESGYDVNELIPKFVKNNEVVRLDGEYVLPANPRFETSFVSVLRIYLFNTYFADVPSICEFGCGPGHNLVALAGMYPDKRLYGFDWAKTSSEILQKIAETMRLNIKGAVFDMFHPDRTLEVPPESGVYTIGTMEQLGTNFEPFLQYVLEKRFPVCVNVETMYELYDQDDLFDFVAARYLEKRGYLRGYIARLRELEVEGKIEIVKLQRTFGSLYHDGYSYVVWKPK